MKKLYSIGETSKINSVSVQALRLYEKMGILIPSYINKSNGYRYYKEEQFIWIDIIKYCNYVKLPLKTLKEFIGSKDPYKIKQLLLEHQKQIKDEISYLNRVNNDINDILISIKDLENEKLLNVFTRFNESIVIRTKSVDSSLNYPLLDEKMREVEMEMAKLHIGYGSYSGVIYDSNFNAKEVFISYENNNVKDKTIKKGNYLTITFQLDDFDVAKEKLLNYINDNNIIVKSDFILIQHVSLSIYYIFNLIVLID